MNYNWPKGYDFYEDIHELEHQITRKAVDTIECRDKEKTLKGIISEIKRINSYNYSNFKRSN